MTSSKGLGADPTYRRLIDLAQATGDIDLVKGMEHLSFNSRLDKNFVIYERTSQVGRTAFRALGLPRSGITVRQAMGRVCAYAASRDGRGYREFAEALTRYLGNAEGLTAADVGVGAPAGKIAPNEGSAYAAEFELETGQQHLDYIEERFDVGSVDVDGSNLGDVGGAPYRRQERRATPQDEATVFLHNPDLIDRGTVAHMDIQDLLSDFVRGHGLAPLRPLDGDPQFDLAWRASSSVVVCEVKSLTAENEVSQLRLGLGQVLSYIYKLNWHHSDEVRGVLAVERQPVDGDWVEICVDHGVTLTWAPDFPRMLPLLGPRRSRWRRGRR